MKEAMDGRRLEVEGKGIQSRVEKMETAQLGELDMIRRVDSNGEALVWCRKCSGDARCRLVPKFMNRCRPEKKDTIGDVRMFNIIFELEKRRGSRQDRQSMES